MRRALMAAVMAAMVMAAGCSSKDESQSKAPSPAPADTAKVFRFDEFQSAPGVDGGEIAIKSLEGQVVLLDLFGTWCPPCRRSVPVLVSLYERFHAKGFEIVGLAYEHPDSEAVQRDRVKTFREEFKIPYTLALGPDSLWRDLEKKADVNGVVPTMLLVDRQGVVRYVMEGLAPGEESTLADRVEQLLAEPKVTVPGSP